MLNVMMALMISSEAQKLSKISFLQVALGMVLSGDIEGLIDFFRSVHFHLFQYHAITL